VGKNIIFTPEDIARIFGRPELPPVESTKRVVRPKGSKNKPKLMIGERSEGEFSNPINISGSKKEKDISKLIEQHFLEGKKCRRYSKQDPSTHLQRNGERECVEQHPAFKEEDGSTVIPDFILYNPATDTNYFLEVRVQLVAGSVADKLYGYPRKYMKNKSLPSNCVPVFLFICPAIADKLKVKMEEEFYETVENYNRNYELFWSEEELVAFISQDLKLWTKT
jgi:hypothetical protein